jgi:hypothetical protein
VAVLDGDPARPLDRVLRLEIELLDQHLRSPFVLGCVFVLGTTSTRQTADVRRREKNIVRMLSSLSRLRTVVVVVLKTLRA